MFIVWESHSLFMIGLATVFAGRHTELELEGPGEIGGIAIADQAGDLIDLIAGILEQLASLPHAFPLVEIGKIDTGMVLEYLTEIRR